MVKGRKKGNRTESKSFRLSEEAVAILSRADNMTEYLDNLIKTCPLALEDELKLVELEQEIQETTLRLNALTAKYNALKESLDKADKRIVESVKQKAILDLEWDNNLGAMVKRVGITKFRAEFLDYNSKRLGIPKQELISYIEGRVNGNND